MTDETKKLADLLIQAGFAFRQEGSVFTLPCCDPYDPDALDRDREPLAKVTVDQTGSVFYEDEDGSQECFDAADFLAFYTKLMRVGWRGLPRLRY